MIVHLFFIIAALIIYLQYILFFLWEGLNEVLYFQSAQTDSAELFISTSLQINFVYPAVSLSLTGAVV